MNWNPVWLPDGRLSFTSMRKGDFDVYVKDVNGAGAETAILSGPDDTDPVAWTRDGRLVFQGSEPDGAYPLKLLDPRQPAQSRRLTEQHVENGGSLSPDDRWLAYHSAANGRPLIYVRPLAGDGPAIPLSPNTGEFPTFLLDGRQLAFVRGRQLIVQPWRDEAGRFETGPERTLTRALGRIGMDLRRSLRRRGRRAAPGSRPHPGLAAIASSSRAWMGPRGVATVVERAAVDHRIQHPGYSPGRWIRLTIRRSSTAPCVSSVHHLLPQAAPCSLTSVC